MSRILSFLLLIGAVTVPARAELSLAPVFGDGMVLQGDEPLPVWGEATPAAEISAQFAGQKQTARANADGTWKLVFNALPASSESRALVVSGDGTTRTINDVLVGDVWICAGQSNMEFRLRDDAFAATALGEAEVPNLRLNLWRYGTQFIYNAPFTPAQVKTLTPENFYTNNWQRSDAQSARDFSAIGWYFGRELQQKIGVPIGMISLAAGGTPTEAWIRRAALAADPELRPIVEGNWLENKSQDDWNRLRGHQNLDKPLADGLEVPSDDLGPNHAFKPTMLWDAGIARIIPFAVKGVLWYQGESNSLEKWRVEQHAKLFPLFVRDWRAQWGKELPFYYVQLSGISTKGYKSQFWPDFRDQQRRFAETLPGTGFAVSSDRGAENNVHPNNKRDVAARLARVALAKTYGQKIEWSGPSPRSLRRDGSNLILSLDHATGLQPAQGDLRGFEIAGANGVFHAAQSRINGATVVLSSDAVPAPVAARYAWQPFPNANLINGDGLPASTFQLALP